MCLVVIGKYVCSMVSGGVGGGSRVDGWSVGPRGVLV